MFNKLAALGRRALSKDEQRNLTIKRRKLWPDMNKDEKDPNPWRDIDKEDPKEVRHIYAAYTIVEGGKEEKGVIEAYRVGDRFYVHKGGWAPSTLSRDVIDFWKYKILPEHPDTIKNKTGN